MNNIIEFLESSINGELSVEEQVRYLDVFRIDSVEAVMLAQAAEFLMERMPLSLEMPGAIDVCGTGGSGLSRINTSTISAFLLAELGIKVAKHGNKAASGRFGSFDLLEKMGIEIEVEKDRLEDLYNNENLAFIYARKFHPVMKNFAEARILYGKPTIFNLLGPLINPARPRRQLIGTAFKDKMNILAGACSILGRDRVFIVNGDGLDEVTLAGKTDVVELNNGKIKSYSLSPEDFGVKGCDFEEFAGGDNEFNYKKAIEILEGNCQSRHKDLVYINGALATVLSGFADDFEDGFRLISKIQTNKHRTYKKLASEETNILEKIVCSKRLDYSNRDFYGAIKRAGVSLVAEIKKASPASGVIRENFDPQQIARVYETGGARAISVLTDERFFGGSFENLKKVREVSRLPLLCKDFIVSEYQVFKARDFGADAVLLIAGILSTQELRKYRLLAESMGMDALVEVHSEKDLRKALKSGALIIGINNRNLDNFEIDLNTTVKLSGMIPKDKLIVSESGICNGRDIGFLPDNVDAVLIGTALMDSENISQKLYELTNVT